MPTFRFIKKIIIMKKIFGIALLMVGALFLGSCEGSDGPQGPPGPPGTGELAQVFETKIDFSNDLNTLQSSSIIKNPVKVYDGDFVLVYVLEGATKDNLPIWSPLPKRYFVTDESTNKEEELEYSFNFSRYDVEINAGATAPFRLFNGDGKGHPGFVKDMVFRIIYVPGADPNTKSKSVKSDKKRLTYEEAIVKYNLQNVEVTKL